MYKVGMLIALLVIVVLGLFYFVPNLKDAIPGTSSTDTATGNTGKFATWRKFVPQSRLFKVSLPHPPQYAKDFVDIPNSDKKRRYDMYASERIDGSLFLVNVITYPPEIDTSLSEDILRQTVEELRRSKPDNELSKLENNHFKNYPTLDFNFNNREFQVEGKVLMDGQRVYVLSYITRIHEFDPADYEHFINSFELLNKNEKQE